jgi:hypothetical protein
MEISIMIKRYLYVFLVISAVLIVSSCDKERTGEGAPILFGIDPVTVVSKSALTIDDINASGTTLYVYGTKNTSTSVFAKEPIQRNANGIWYPQTNINPYKKWENGSSYSFYGIASSADLSSDNMEAQASSVSTPGIDVYNKGFAIKVNQPTSYDNSLMIDYLLSRSYTVSNGQTKPLVKLAMEHSMPSVEIYVIKAEAMYGARLKNITLSGFYSSGTMTVTSLSPWNSSSLNPWTCTLSGSANTSYNITGDLSSSQINIENEIAGTTPTEAKMQIITMRQQLTQSAKLAVEYWINERTASSSGDNYVLYSETFNLYSFTPQVWEFGHRIIYTLKVDSGIHLTGTVVPWTDVDYIEGTILPAL